VVRRSLCAVLSKKWGLICLAAEAAQGAMNLSRPSSGHRAGRWGFSRALKQHRCRRLLGPKSVLM